MNILVLAVGRVREKAIALLCEDYLERIQRYGHRVAVVEVKEESGRKMDSLILEKEAHRLRARLPEFAYKIALDREGEAFDSPGLARKLEELALRGQKRIVFLVGGHLGLEKSLVSSCDFRLSLSRLTFIHEMARLILLEQLYRANSILRGEPYHK